MAAPKKVQHLSTEQLAERLGDGFSPETVKRWRRTGDGPRFIRVGKHVRYRECDIEAWERKLLATA